MNQAEKVTRQTASNGNCRLDFAQLLDETLLVEALLLGWPFSMLTDQPGKGLPRRRARDATNRKFSLLRMAPAKVSTRHCTANRAETASEAFGLQFVPDTRSADTALGDAASQVLALSFQQRQAARARRPLRK